MQLTLDEQLKMLNRLVPEWGVIQNPAVAHGKPYTQHEFVTHLLDTIFSPACWSFEVGTIKPITLPNNDQLIYVPGMLTIRLFNPSPASGKCHTRGASTRIVEPGGRRSTWPTSKVSSGWRR